MMWERTSSLQETVSKDMDEDRYYVTRFLSGEESAFTFLVNKYRKPVYHIAFRFTRNSQEADDITQDTFVKAYQGLSKFRGDASFKTWLFRIATNLSINTTKSGRIRKDSGEAPEESAKTTHQPVLSNMMAEERKSKLYKAIQLLPPRQRQALMLKSLKEMSCQEVADVMKCSVGTVKANVFNAVRKLKGLLEGELS